MKRDEQDRAEQFRPAVLGSYPGGSADFWEYASDEEIALETRPGRRLFTRLLPVPKHSYSRLAGAPVILADDLDDDIPF